MFSNKMMKIKIFKQSKIIKANKNNKIIIMRKKNLNPDLDLEINQKKTKRIKKKDMKIPQEVQAAVAMIEEIGKRIREIKKIRIEKKIKKVKETVEDE